MNKFTDVHIEYINEEFKPDKLLTYTYPHFASKFPLILIRKTAKAYNVAWRTKNKMRECWIPVKAISSVDDNVYRVELKQNYKTFWVKHWYIQSSQSEIYSNKANYMFFDEWSAALERLTNHNSFNKKPKLDVEEEEYYTKSGTPYFAQSFPSYLKQYRPE